MALFSVPTARDPGDAITPASFKVYTSSPAKQWRLAALAMGFALAGLLLPLKDISRWLAGGPMPEGQMLVLVLAGLFFLPFGLLYGLNALRGLPRLTIMPQGLRLEGALGILWADWDSIEPFTITTAQYSRFTKPTQTASARVTGSQASKGLLRSKTFRLPDHFPTPISAIAAELNAARMQATGFVQPQPVWAAAAPEAAIDPSRGSVPWLTISLLIILILIFVVENVVGPRTGLTPLTLFSLGALSRTAVTGGEWYRLFTAPLLHANFAHIAGNGVALLLGGVLLERLVGRWWFFAFFVVGALGGSLMSLAVGPPQLVSVGASGALMGLLAALLVGSFHLPHGNPARTKLQVNSLRFLIPSLLPLTAAASVEHIDYGAHFGGAISGALLGVVLLMAWPQTERLPRLRIIAAGISIVGLLLFVVSGGFAIANHQKYDIVLIPEGDVPRNATYSQERAASLVNLYPHDPRSHYFLGLALTRAKDDAGAERELRLAFREAQAYSELLGPQSERAMGGALALFLVEHGRKDEAKSYARPACLMPWDNSDYIHRLLKEHQLCD
jgi:rhomboid protease GluP